MRSRPALVLALAATCLAPACGEVWNDPYPAVDARTNTLYTSFAERPKHLDPVQSYTEDEAKFTQQVYEPLLQYHYLKVPYELVPLTAAAVPVPVELEGGKFTQYELKIRPGIRYQPHPAFNPQHQTLSSEAVGRLKSPYELAAPGTRELLADDYIYQIKRLAHPRLHSPIFGLMSEYIVGLDAYSKQLKAVAGQQSKDAWLDLREFPLEGVEKVDDHTLRIRLKGRYPQFAYWLAMPFFAPIPWEVEKFFSQPGMAEKNFTLDWWPVGTGAYMLTENDPNARMVLERNPNFRGEAYPSEGEPGDAKQGLLRDAGKTMPFIDRVVYSREKEGIPYWNKFLQGYYDVSGIGSDNFDQAVRISIEGETALTPEMEKRGISLRTAVTTTILYLGFNWNDAVVGGGKDKDSAERARKLRHALTVAIDYEEFLSIFANGRGIVAQSPLAPGIFGYRDGQEGVNPVAYEWKDGRAQRRPLEQAKKLMAEAGYPGGRDAKTGAVAEKASKWERFDEAKVKDLLTAFKNLKASDFAKQGADTGIDKAAEEGGVLKVKFKDGNGDVVLKVGKKQEADNRYLVKEGGDGTIFVISSYSAALAVGDVEKFSKPDPNAKGKDAKDGKDAAGDAPDMPEMPGMPGMPSMPDMGGME